MAFLTGLVIGLAVLYGLAIFAVVVYVRGKQKALASWQEGTVKPALAQVAGQNEQIGNLTRAVDLLVPPDARPTTAHRAALPPAPVGEKLAAEDRVVAHVLHRPRPRIRVEIQRTPFASAVDALVSYGDVNVLHVDARDIDVREARCASMCSLSALTP
jgi:hypothetical protein